MTSLGYYNTNLNKGSQIKDMAKPTPPSRAFIGRQKRGTQWLGNKTKRLQK